MAKRLSFTERFAIKLEKLKQRQSNEATRLQERLLQQALKTVEKEHPASTPIIQSVDVKTIIKKQTLQPPQPIVCDCGQCEECQSRKENTRKLIEKHNHRIAKEVGFRPSTWAPEEDDKLREIYQNGETSFTFKAAQKAFPQKTPSDIFRRAAILDLIRVRERYRWSDEELMVVEKFADMSLEGIQRKLVGITPPNFQRTRAAIASQIHALRFRTNMEGLHHSALSEALGISVYLLHKWREQGLIEGQRLPSLDMHKDRKPIKETAIPIFYPNKNIYKFVMDNPRIFDLRRVNQQWFMDLMAYGRGLK